MAQNGPCVVCVHRLDIASSLPLAAASCFLLVPLAAPAAAASAAAARAPPSITFTIDKASPAPAPVASKPTSTPTTANKAIAIKGASAVQSTPSATGGAVETVEGTVRAVIGWLASSGHSSTLHLYVPSKTTSPALGNGSGLSAMESRLVATVAPGKATSAADTTVWAGLEQCLYRGALALRVDQALFVDALAPVTSTETVCLEHLMRLSALPALGETSALASSSLPHQRGAGSTSLAPLSVERSGPEMVAAPLADFSWPLPPPAQCIVASGLGPAGRWSVLDQSQFRLPLPSLPAPHGTTQDSALLPMPRRLTLASPELPSAFSWRPVQASLQRLDGMPRLLPLHKSPSDPYAAYLVLSYATANKSMVMTVATTTWAPVTLPGFDEHAATLLTQALTADIFMQVGLVNTNCALCSFLYFYSRV
jgi:hypothetical protein